MINGTYTKLYIKIDEDYFPISCITDDAFSESVSMLPTTTRDNESWSTSVPTNQSYSISFNGLVVNTLYAGGDFTKMSYDRLVNLKRSRTLIEWRRQTDDNIFVDSGFGYITEIGDNRTVDEFISFNATIEGYGVPTSTTGEGNLIDNVIFLQMTFDTYADMIAFGTPLNATIARVLSDENKGLENTEYRIFPDGTRMWIANVEDSN